MVNCVNVQSSMLFLLVPQFDHPLLQDLVINEQPKKTESSAISQNVVVTECYKVTFDVLPVLSKFGYE